MKKILPAILVLVAVTAAPAQSQQKMDTHRDIDVQHPQWKETFHCRYEISTYNFAIDHPDVQDVKEAKQKVTKCVEKLNGVNQPKTRFVRKEFRSSDFDVVKAGLVKKYGKPDYQAAFTSCYAYRCDNFVAVWYVPGELSIVMFKSIGDNGLVRMDREGECLDERLCDMVTGYDRTEEIQNDVLRALE